VRVRIFLAGLGSFLTVYALIKTSMDFSAIIGFMGLMVLIILITMDAFKEE